jgi:hypothetical protein
MDLFFQNLVGDDVFQGVSKSEGNGLSVPPDYPSRDH